MKQQIIALSVAVSLSGACAVPLQASIYADPFSSLVVFGDSLSDPGNLFAATGYPPDPYFMGRFSNSFNYADQLAQDFTAQGKASFNFAVGGAKALGGAGDPPDFEDQRLIFGTVPQPVLGDRPLAVVFFGSNDILGAAASATPDAIARAAADEIKTQIEMFDTLVVKDFVLLNVGLIGVTPRFTVPFVSDGSGGIISNPFLPLAPAANSATNAFNAQLAANADMLNDGTRDIIEVDSAAEIGKILADPTAYGYADATSACGIYATTVGPFNFYDFATPGCDLTDPALVDFVWWDDLHLTSGIHDQLADLTRSTIAAAQIPLPMPIALLGAGVMMLAGLQRLRAA